MAVTKYLDYDGLLYFWVLVKGKLALKADKATTLSGYGITDAKISNGTITLGNNTITPITSITNSNFPDSGVTAGTYRSVTVDAKGIVTNGTNPTTLSGYGITDSYTKSEVDAKLASGVNYRGSVATYSDLPASPAVGDMYNVTATDENYIWAGASGNVAAHWDPIGALVNIVAISNSEIDTVVAS